MQERERMAIELRLAQKLESVGRLAAHCHEINTPIQYVGDSVSFLQSAETDWRGCEPSIDVPLNAWLSARRRKPCYPSWKRWNPTSTSNSVPGDSKGVRAHSRRGRARAAIVRAMKSSRTQTVLNTTTLT